MSITAANTKIPSLLDLIDDPVCSLLMKRDGVTRNEILSLMLTVKPVVTHGRHRSTVRDGVWRPDISQRPGLRFRSEGGAPCQERRSNG